MPNTMYTLKYKTFQVVVDDIYIVVEHIDSQIKKYIILKFLLIISYYNLYKYI